MSKLRSDGPWEPIETIMGGVMAVVLWAYLDPAVGAPGARRSAAAGVLGLCGVIVLAYPLQSLSLPLSWALPVAFLASTAAALVALSGRQQYGHSKSDAPAEGHLIAEKVEYPSPATGHERQSVTLPPATDVKIKSSMPKI